MSSGQSGWVLLGGEEWYAGNITDRKPGEIQHTVERRWNLCSAPHVIADTAGGSVSVRLLLANSAMAALTP